MQTRKRLRIAIQKKGRLNSDSLALLKSIGINMQLSKSSLYCHSANAPVDCLFVRDDDIPVLVNSGVCDLGIVGENVLTEFSLAQNNKEKTNIVTERTLGFGKCRLSLAAPNDFEFKGIQSLNGMRVATSYPNTIKDFSDQYNLSLRALSISGSVEIAPSLDMSDIICDLVSTGRTLEEHNLKELQVVLNSEAVLIKSTNILDSELQQFYQRLLDRIDGANQAKECKYVMFHAPKEALKEITQLLPGHEEPTVIPLSHSNDKVAVHIVTKEGVFWQTLEQLKKARASSILVLPIEKMLA